jgi:replicative DNA helicase
MNDALPNARDAEELVIGAVLMDPEQAPSVCRLLDPADFAMPIYRAAMSAIAERYAHGEGIDYALVVADISAGAPDDANTIAATLTAAITRTPWAHHAVDYARQVLAVSTRRQLIATAGEVAGWAHSETADIDGLVAATLRQFEALDARAAAAESGNVREVLEGIGRGGNGRGWSTGILCYDQWTPGIRPREVHTVAGYTGSGKTWATCQITNALVDQGARVAFFSVEMPTSSLVLRLLANRAGALALSYGGADATFAAGDLDRIRAGVADLSAASDDGRLAVYHDQTTLAQMAAIVRQTRPDVAVVDYIQLVEAPSHRMTEYEATTANAIGVQRLAQRAACAVIMVSQVNEAHQASGGLSRAMGLKSSGAIGAVSDVVLSLSQADRPNVLAVAARKNRHGPDAHQGSRAELSMDKGTGRLVPA